MLSFILSLIYHTAFPMVYVVKDTPLTTFSYLLLLFCGNLQLLGNNVYFLTSWWAVTGGCLLLVIASIASRFLRLTLIFGDLNIQSISQFFSVRHKKKNLNRFPQHLLCVVFFSSKPKWDITRYCHKLLIYLLPYLAQMSLLWWSKHF